ncbi:MAG TPA: hypothetical protein VF498_03560 [Anaerolineales bacterium]
MNKEPVVRTQLFVSLLILILVASCSLTTPAVPLENTPTELAEASLAPEATLTLPNGTPVAAPKQSHWSSLKNAQDQVPFPLWVPDPNTLPAGFAFEDAQVIAGNNVAAVTLFYEGKDGLELVLGENRLPSPMSTPVAPHQAVQVRGQPGFLLAPSGTDVRTLVWEEAGRVLSVGGKFSQDDLQRIASGLAPYK